MWGPKVGGKIMNVLERFAERWAGKSWSVGKTTVFPEWNAQVHGHGQCVFGRGDSPQAALDDAVAKFTAIYPDEHTADRKALADARAGVARLTEKLGEAA
jgi:hypothetical protein